MVGMVGNSGLCFVISQNRRSLLNQNDHCKRTWGIWRTLRSIGNYVQKQYEKCFRPPPLELVKNRHCSSYRTYGPPSPVSLAITRRSVKSQQIARFTLSPSPTDSPFTLKNKIKFCRTCTRISITLPNINAKYKYGHGITYRVCIKRKNLLFIRF